MSDFDVFDQIAEQINESNVIKEDSTPITEQTDGCLHENIIEEYGISSCQDCGIQLKKNVVSESKMYMVTDNRSIGDGNRCWAPRKKNRSIRDDIKGLGFSDPIINKTDDIFKTIANGRIFREDKRRSIIVACLLEAHKLLDIPVSIEYLLTKLPIGNGNITVGMKMVEINIKKYDTNKVRVTYTSPVDSIRDILSKWDSDTNTVEEIIKLYTLIDDKSSLLNRSRSKSVAAGLIYYYALATKRSNIKLKDFSKRVELSESTINTLAKEISGILKTPQILAY